MRFAFYTLGCKTNQYETQAMEQLLMQSGHTLGSFDEICDGYIINTCTVTAVSDKKSRNAIRRVRKLNPAAAVGVCGCYAQSSPDEIRKLDVDVLIGTDEGELHLGDRVDEQLVAAHVLLPAMLRAATLHLVDGHAANISSKQRIFENLELLGTNDRRNFLHSEFLSSRAGLAEHLKPLI